MVEVALVEGATRGLAGTAAAVALAGQEVDEAAFRGGAVEATEATRAIACEFDDEVIALVVSSRLAQGLLDRVTVDLATHEFIAQCRGPELFARAQALDEVGRESLIVDKPDALESIELCLGHAHINLAPQQQVADLGAGLPTPCHRVHRDVLGATLLGRIRRLREGLRHKLLLALSLRLALSLGLRGVGQSFPARLSFGLARAGQIRDGSERVVTQLAIGH